MGRANLNHQFEELFAGLADQAAVPPAPKLAELEPLPPGEPPPDLTFVSTALDGLFSAQPEPPAAQTEPVRAAGLPPALLLLGLAAVIIIVAGLGYALWPKAAAPALLAAHTPLPTLAPTPPPALHNPPVGRQPAAVAVPMRPTPPAIPGGLSLVVTPAPDAVGWVTSQDGASYVYVPNIHAGQLGGHTYYGIIQFDLSAIPRHATIAYAALSLTGLDDQYLGQGGSWRLQLLAPQVSPFPGNLTFKMLHEAPLEITIDPPVAAADLSAGEMNSFIFGPKQLDALQAHLENGRASFRVDGPADNSANNRFTWDSGYRNQIGLETLPSLTLVFIPPPEPELAIVTSTPIPENIVTAAAMAATTTAIAATVGTFTPVPGYWVTPILVASQRQQPGNRATATFQAQAATAEAFLFGTATATPINLWTVTPNPTASPTASKTPSATPAPATSTPPYVLVTATSTPQNVVTAAAIAARATAIAATIGTYTPVPANWATPDIVTATPIPPPPANMATATFRAQVATAEAFLFDSSRPAFVWTATPTPYLVRVDGLVATPWAEGTPTPAPVSIPAELVGRIAFLSNRSGGPEPLRRPLVYVVDADGGNLSVLTDPAIYEAAVARDQYSADQRFRAFVKEAVGFAGRNLPAVYWLDALYNAENQLTHFGRGIAWHPAWSPTREQLVFVSNDSQDDEIWVVNRDGSNLLRLTETNEGFNAREIGKDTFQAELNGHPSWSPDGSQIVFWSNRTGHREIWIMDADGRNAHSISVTGYDDWDPVWIKYTDPVRQ